MSATIDNENSMSVVKALAKQLLSNRDEWRDKCRVAERELQIQQEQSKLAGTPLAAVITAATLFWCCW